MLHTLLCPPRRTTAHTHPPTNLHLTWNGINALDSPEAPSGGVVDELPQWDVVLHACGGALQVRIELLCGPAKRIKTMQSKR